MTHSSNPIGRRTFLRGAAGLATLGGLGLAPSAASACTMPAFANMPVARVLEYTRLYRHWVFNANTHGYLQGSPVTPGRHTHWVSLKARPPIKFLQYERQPKGINLGWTGDASAHTERNVRRFFIVRELGGTGVVRYGERFALGWDRPDKPFLRYKPRKYGINLDWTSGWAPEWTILGTRANGEPVAQGEYAVLFNTTHNQPMHYFDRHAKGHIGWPTSDPDFWTRFGTGYIHTDPCPRDRAVRALQYLANG